MPVSALITGMLGMTRAFVKIQDGCDDRCTFCTIWMARGAVRSRPTNLIIDEINGLAAKGYREVALTGVHIGKFSDSGLSFVGLLRELVVKTYIERIRLSSLNPIELTEDLISLLKSTRKICPHIHLSIQSGDDSILRAMGRKYTREDIVNVTDSLINAIPDITLGADFITGFPGESLGAFENSRRLIEIAGLHHLHIFPYSDRPGTIATDMRQKISSAEKDRRTSILRELGHHKRMSHLGSYVGKKLMVLFENRKQSEIMTGLSENYLRIDAPYDKQFLGRIVGVTPNDINGEHLVINAITPDPSGKKRLTLDNNKNKFVEPPKSG
jgi:threonylcarbamoyladenosine tRNA methylthiotransferase MtaB